MDREGSQLDAVTIGGSGQSRFRGVLIDRESRDVVFAAVKDLLARERNRSGVAIGQINDASIRVDVNRSRALTRPDIARIGERLFDEERLRAECPVGFQFVDIELILPLDRHEHPRLRRMKIEMARPKAKAVSWRDRLKRSENAVLEAEHFDRARIFWLAARRIVAACDENRGLIVWRGADLVGIDPCIELVRLVYQLADRSVGVKPVSGNIARFIVRGEHIFAGAIDAGVNWPRR